MNAWSRVPNRAPVFEDASGRSDRPQEGQTGLRKVRQASGRSDRPLSGHKALASTASPPQSFTVCDLNQLEQAPWGSSIYFSPMFFSKRANQASLYAAPVQQENREDPKWQPVTVTDIQLYPAINRSCNQTLHWTTEINSGLYESPADSRGAIRAVTNASYTDFLVQALLSFFQLFFTDVLIQELPTQTNLYATQTQQKKRADPKWQPVTANDIKLYLAINIMMRIHDMPRPKNYWSKDDKLDVPCISRLMSRTRFEKIGRYFHVNDRL
ncbi:hypothetical protein ACOMHN_010430 [Nucella lapillus]